MIKLRLIFVFIPFCLGCSQREVIDAAPPGPLPENRTMIKHNDVVFHYYCAVGDQGRVIAVATSKPLNQ